MGVIDFSEGGQTKVKVTLAFVGAMIVGLYVAYSWHFNTFLSKAEAQAYIQTEERNHHEDIKQADRVLKEQVKANEKVLSQHMIEFEETQMRQALKEVQELIHDTNDKLFALQVFPDDARRREQERELKKRLTSYKLRLDCLLKNNHLCD